MEIFGNLDLSVVLLIAVSAFLTSTIHGATGIAGGFLLTVILALVIGVKPVVPVVSVALLISHSSRAILNFRDFNREVYASIIIPAIPAIAIVAYLYTKMTAPWIALLLGGIVLISIPMRRWARSRELRVKKPVLSSAGVIYGALAGASVGPGMLLIPFMLGYGLKKEAFVATLAAIALTANITRVGVFGSTSMLDMDYLVLGIVAGLATIPGNWVGRHFLRSMTNETHTNLVDLLTLIGAINFFWLAYRAF